MRVDEIEIHDGVPDRAHEVVGEVKVKAGAPTLLSKAPTLDEINARLREQALRLGANGIVNAKYRRGATATSWKGLTATGTAVKFEVDETTCPYCAEPIKRAAIRCKHCGADLSPSQSA